MNRKQEEELVTKHSQRIVLSIEYDGSLFHGWQRQSHATSVQQKLEEALTEVSDHKVDLVCAGRTDTGVHATSQVVHFDCFNSRPQKAWLKGANSILPASISIRTAQTTSNDFHARFSALNRSYLYIIDNDPIKPALMNQGITWYRKHLNVEKMERCCGALLGEQDFSSFRSSQCQSTSADRNVHSIQCRRFNNFVLIEITANAFLHHMVRNIVGVLLEIGDGRKPIRWINEVLSAKDRCKAGITAPPQGLYLVGVEYPSQFHLTFEPKAPLFLPLPISVKSGSWIK